MKKLFVDPSQHQGLRLLDAALTYIEFHPGEWNQRFYRCGTGMCLAGHIALTMAGGILADPRNSESDTLLAVSSDEDPYYDYKLRIVTTIAERAKSLLGEAYIPGMFDAGNSLSTLKRYRQQAVERVTNNVK